MNTHTYTHDQADTHTHTHTQWERDAPVSPEDVDAAVQSLAPADIVRG